MSRYNNNTINFKLNFVCNGKCNDTLAIHLMIDDLHANKGRRISSKEKFLK